MKKLIRASLLVIGIISLASCGINMPLAQVKSDNNRTYEVDYLFEHDGCKVYRFYDQGHYVYFTNCTGDVTSFAKDSTETRIVNVVKNGAE